MLLQVPVETMAVTPRQPFLLLALGLTLKAMDDPDWLPFTDRPNSFVQGVPVGMLEKMPRTPSVCARKLRWRKYDDSVYSAKVSNYVSAAGLCEVIEKQFVEEEALGMMIPMSMAEAVALYPGDKLRISAQGAIDKEDGSYRVIHDGTHGTQVNCGIRPRDAMAMPGPHDLRELLTICQEDAPGAHFGRQADVRKAHRRFLHAQDQWGLLACQSDSASDKVWLNCVGTFGVGCAAYYWFRLAAAISRISLKLWGQAFAWQLIYADDLHWIAHGPQKFKLILTALFLWELVGTPFSWAKSRGGLSQDWVGFWCDYGKFPIGISEKRCLWLAREVEDIVRDNMALVCRLQELLGRLGFACQILSWGKPFLAPIYAWCAAAPPGACLALPRPVKSSMIWLLRRLKFGKRTVNCTRVMVQRGEVFRTDARAEKDIIVIGGWKCENNAPCKESSWFSEELRPEQHPWLFSKGSGQRAIAAGELLGTAVALSLWTETPRDSAAQRISLSGRTDNQGNSFMTKKNLTTAYPTAPVLMQIAELVEDRNISFTLEWRRRTENVEADALSNGDFDLFDEALRVRVDIVSMFPLIQELAEFEKEFRVQLEEKKLQ